MEEHHKTYKYTEPEKSGSKQKEAQTEEGHTTSSPDDWLLPLLGSDLRLDCKEKIIIHQLKEKGRDTVTVMNHYKIKERRKKEVLPFSLSTDSPMIFCLLWVHLEGPKGDWGIKSKDPEEP